MFRLILILTLVLPAPVMAREAYALLVGASTYPNLEERFWLRGPANDVDLVATYLTTESPVPFSPENVLILADGVEGREEPTLAAIRGAFAELEARVEDGDFVYLHFSGHGSQAPALDPSTEIDGLDELFLPTDIGPWQDTIGTVENALVDDEIGTLIGALRAKGADVWAVFDSCHSGTVTRAAPTGADDVRLRKLTPDALGVPVEAIVDATSTRAVAPREETPVETGGDEGGFVAFYAAQTNETTPEKLMPRSTKDRLHGVFTFTIFETLAARPDLTYRQLGQEILRKYAVKNLALSTPLFEGDLDRVVFGGEETSRVAQWPGDVRRSKIAIPAGSLHGLAPGTQLAVMASAADPDEAALAMAEVTKVKTFTADVVLKEGSLEDLPRGVFLRKVSEAVDLTLRVALPEAGTEVADAVGAAIAVIAADGLLGPRISFVPAGEDADIRLAAIPQSPRPDAVWFLPSTGIAEASQWERLPSISTGDKSAQELAAVMADNIAHIAKAQNILRIGAATSSNAVKADVDLFAAEFDYDEVEEVEGTRSPIALSTVPEVQAEDVVGIRVENTTEGMLDMNVLYVGSDFAVLWVPHANVRLQPGDVFEDVIVGISPENFGRDQLVVVLSPAEEQSSVEDLSFLRQGPLERTRGAASSDEGFRGLLDEAGFGTTTRAAVALGGRKRPQPLIVQVPIDTVPRVE